LYRMKFEEVKWREALIVEGKWLMSIAYIVEGTSRGWLLSGNVKIYINQGGKYG